jgi:hypothetical protein
MNGCLRTHQVRLGAGEPHAALRRESGPDRLVVRKYDPMAGRHVEFREER